MKIVVKRRKQQAVLEPIPSLLPPPKFTHNLVNLVLHLRRVYNAHLSSLEPEVPLPVLREAFAKEFYPWLVKYVIHRLLPS